MPDGLHNITSSSAIQHSITAPPERKPGESEADFAKRYDEWHWQTCVWKTESKAVGRDA